MLHFDPTSPQGVDQIGPTLEIDIARALQRGFVTGSRRPGGGRLKDAACPAGAEATVDVDLFDDRPRAGQHSKPEIRPCVFE